MILYTSYITVCIHDHYSYFSIMFNQIIEVISRIISIIFKTIKFIWEVGFYFFSKVAGFYNTLSNRIITLILLLCIVIWFAGTYIYLFQLNTTRLIISIEPKDAPIHLRLTANEYRENVVASNLFKIERDCVGNCTIDPIPAFEYSLEISFTGRDSIRDTIILEKNRENMFTYKFTDQVFLHNVENEIQVSPTTILYREEQFAQQNPNIFTGARYITDINGIWYYSLLQGNATKFYRFDGSEIQNHFSIPIKAYSMDKTNRYIYYTQSGFTYLSSLFTGKIFTFKREDPIVAVYEYENDVYIKTEKDIFTYDIGTMSFRRNPYYNDLILLDSTYALALIYPNDKEKRQLLNIPDGNTVLIRINRLTGERELVAKTQEKIAYMFYEKWALSLFTSDNKKIEVLNIIPQ